MLAEVRVRKGDKFSWGYSGRGNQGKRGMPGMGKRPTGRPDLPEEASKEGERQQAQLGRPRPCGRGIDQAIANAGCMAAVTAKPREMRRGALVITRQTRQRDRRYKRSDDGQDHSYEQPSADMPMGLGQTAAQTQEQGNDEGVGEDIRDEGDAKGEDFK